MSEPGRVSEVDLNALRVRVEGLDLEENKIGSGAYGVVFEVTVDGKKCIAKKLHNILLQEECYGQEKFIVRKFSQECRILSQLDHPNVVGFVGVHYGRDRNDISLIMERLDCDLADFVKKNPDTPLCDRLHILYDVSKGLEYLHSQSPPLIHRDLTAPNVLLTEDLTAKIGDLGVSRFIDPSMTTRLTTNPGNLVYMPPEGRVENPRYTTKLDIFSFGTLIVHTVIGVMPRVYDILSSDPNKARYEREGKVELMRRNTAVHNKMGETHCLYPLVVHCLHDSPEQRPSVGEVKISLRKLCLKQYPKMTLLEACKTGKMEVVKLLLEGGTDPNQADEDGSTALMVAAQNGHLKIVEMLIASKANVNHQNNNNSTALQKASMTGHDEVVRVLLAARATVNTQRKWGQSPLWSASYNGQLGCVHLLIEAGANVDMPKEVTVTSVHTSQRPPINMYQLIRC